METYVINYRDNTHMALELSEESSKILFDSLRESKNVAVIIPDVGFLELVEIRSIIKQKPEAVQENPSYSGEVTEEEKQYAEYLRKVDKWSAFDGKQQSFDEFVENERQKFKDEADF